MNYIDSILVSYSKACERLREIEKLDPDYFPFDKESEIRERLPESLREEHATLCKQIAQCYAIADANPGSRLYRVLFL